MNDVAKDKKDNFSKELTSIANVFSTKFQSTISLTSKFINRGNLFKGELAVFLFIWLGFMTGFFVVIYTVYESLQANNKVEFNIKNEIATQTQKAAAKISEYQNEIEKLGDEMAIKISSGEIKKEAIAATIKEVHLKHPGITGISVAFAPYRFSKTQFLYAPYSYYADGKLNFINIGQKYNYAAPVNKEAKWFTDGMAQEKFWHEPQYGAIAKTMIVRYTVRFYDNLENRNAQRNPAGTIFFYCSKDAIRKIMSEINLGQTGYGFILSNEERFIYHPDKILTDGVYDMQTAAHDLHYQFFSRIDRAMSNYKAGEVFEESDSITGQTFWHSYQETQNSQWRLISTFPMDEVPVNINEARTNYIRLIIFVAIFLTFAFALLFRVYNFSDLKWNFPISVSLILIISVCLIWYYARLFSPPQQFEKNLTSILNRRTLDQIVKVRNEEAINKEMPLPVYIPTGLYIESVKFENVSEVTIMGKVWNVIPKQNAFPVKRDSSNMLVKGVSFLNTVASTITPDYETINDDSSKTVNSKFSITIRQQFDYLNYPFDYKAVATTVQYAEPNKNVLLVPDMDSYLYTNPSAKPGVGRNIVMSEWNFKSSYFFTTHINYNSTFGLKKHDITTNAYAMGVCMILDRSILSAFVSFMLPYFVIIVLLFALLLTMEETQRSGFLASAAGLLFTVLLSHYSLRQALMFDKIVYFEYLFFLTYVVIILLVINAFLYFSESKIRLIKMRKNYYIQLIYWPFVLFMQLLLTIYIYY